MALSSTLTARHTKPAHHPHATIADAECILVAVATAGIGHALQLALHDLQSKPTVIVAGRRQEGSTNSP